MQAPQADNPYQPPQAVLNEAPQDDSPAPRAVRRAVTLLWTNVAFAVATAVAIWTGILPILGGSAPNLLTAFSQLLSVAITAWLAVKVSSGRNWARWVLMVFVVWGLAGWAFTLALMPTFAPQVMAQMPWYAWIPGAVHTLLELGAAVFLFTREAADWFGRKRSAL